MGPHDDHSLGLCYALSLLDRLDGVPIGLNGQRLVG